MNTDPGAEKLIERLSRELAPVRAAGPSWIAATAGWLAGGGVVSLGFVVWLKTREDLAAQWGQAYFVLRGAAFLISAWGMSWAVQRLGIPGRARLGRERGLAMALPLTLALVLGYQLWLQSLDPAATIRCNLSEAACTEAILFLSLGPAALFFLRARRQASTSPGWSGALIGGSSSLLGAAALGLHCSNESPLHLLAWHLLLPLGILGAAGFGIGRRWLRW